MHEVLRDEMTNGLRSKNLDAGRRQQRSTRNDSSNHPGGSTRRWEMLETQMNFACGHVSNCSDHTSNRIPQLESDCRHAAGIENTMQARQLSKET